MKDQEEIEKTASVMLRFSNTIAVSMVLLLLTFLVLLFDIRLPETESGKTLPIPRADTNGLFTAEAREALAQKLEKAKYWQAPDVSEIELEKNKEQLLYGRDLVVNTSLYFGKKGRVEAGATNGMNCQNCHLEAGTKVFGNNYGAVASTYPKYRARSGSVESINKRVNDCFERSLNGKSLDSSSREMKALVAYIEWLGKGIEKGKKVTGSGFKDLTYLKRAASAEKGEVVYQEKCQTCHQPNGEGQLNGDWSAYTYPPLWGPNSYNDGAGLYRLSTFARYVKYNMPLGASYAVSQLSDEEAWDVAAFVNSQERPKKDHSKDWPNLEEKPFDHPFGPYTDGFDEQQHKYGPFESILEK